MDIYHVWVDLAPGVQDVEFADDLGRYLEHLKQRELIAGWRLTRRKLGLGPPGMGEFHIEMEATDLAQLERAFQGVGARSGAIEGFHAAVNQKVAGLTAALYRDFPDAFRERGQERF